MSKLSIYKFEFGSFSVSNNFADILCAFIENCFSLLIDLLNVDAYVMIAKILNK